MQIISSFATHLLQRFSPETAHHLAIKMLRLFPVKNLVADLNLHSFSQTMGGLSFPHPIGLAAGFDKDAEVFDQLGNLGFSFVEVGTVTPQPQPGNPTPRLFRLPEHQAIINRYGFNSQGMERVRENLKRFPHTCIIGVNLGKNKTSENFVEDYLLDAETLLDQADYFTINVSSPNTPGLRDLQSPENLAPVIDGIRNLMEMKNRVIPIFVKLSPDMTRDQEETVVKFLTDKVQGIIISNTTTDHETVKNHPQGNEAGGVSGLPLRSLSTEMLKRVYAITQGKIILIGCGGIFSGQDAYEKLKAGANLLQIYTSFIYQGPLVLRKILLELQTLMPKI